MDKLDPTPVFSLQMEERAQAVCVFMPFLPSWV